MTARTTYEAAVQGATANNATTNGVDSETARQEAVNGIGINAGTNPQFGASNSQITAINAANIAKLAARDAAERSKQAKLGAARDALRTAGDFSQF